MNVGVREKDICSEKPQKEWNSKLKAYILAFNEEVNSKLKPKKIM